MSDYPRNLSQLTGPGLVRLFLKVANRPHTTPAERAEFFDFKARVFATLADRDGNPDAAKAAARARSDRDRLLLEIEAANGGEMR
ncbi:hypothetical protein [Nocardiopsis synnemataformans]|uniref:hypothetical protein n=1 Tax=Nocardiopsis synnemataformans TaxID=61305 RepID=UPI003EBB7A1E